MSDDDVCGETFDHDEEVTFNDGVLIQWMCRRCGAEGWDDLSEMPR